MAKAAKQVVVESTLTDRYQTTVPGTVRDVLGLKKRDKIRFVIRDGQVVLSRAQSEGDDPALGVFLNFLEADIAASPQHIRPVSHKMVTRAKSLVTGVEVDLENPLPDEDE